MDGAAGVASRRPLLIEPYLLWPWRRTASTWVFPTLLVVLVLLVTLGGDPAREGRPQDAVLLAHMSAMVVLGPAVVALAAYEVRRHVHRRLVELEASSARARWQIAAYAALPVWLWAAGCYLVLTLSVVVRAILVTPEWPGLDIVLLTIAVLFAQACLGCALGWLVPLGAGSALGAFLSVAGLYAVIVAQTYQLSAARLFPVLDETWDPIYKPSPDHILIAITWLVSVGLLLVLLSPVRPLARLLRRTAVPLLASVAVGAALVLLPSSSDSFYGQLKSVADPHTCASDGDFDVCMYTMDGHLTSVFVAAHQQVVRALGDIAVLPSGVAELGLERRPGTIVYTSSDGVADVDSAVGYLLSGIVGQPDCSAWPTSPVIGHRPWGEFIGQALALRVEPKSSIDPYFVNALRQFEKMPLPRQDAWLRRALGAYRLCKAPPQLGAS